MKKLLRFTLVALMAIISGNAFAAEVTDELTWDKLLPTGTGNSYTDFADKTVTSDAVYAGRMSSGTEKYIQLRMSGSNEGIVTTKSGGKVKSITIQWNEATTTERTLSIYGKNEAYATAADLYGEAAGTLLGEIATSDANKTLTVDGDYTFIGIRSKQSAQYIDKITIVWEAEGGNGGGNATEAKTLIDYPTSKDGVSINGTTVEGTVKLHLNKDAVDCLSLKNGYVTDGEINGNYIKLTTDGGFKSGDVVTIAGAINNADETKRATAVLFSSEDGKIANVINKFADFINSRLVESEPVEESFTLTADYADLYLGRDGGTAANLTLIKVVRAAGGSNGGSDAKGIELSWDTMLKNETGDNAADQSEIKFLDENGNETGFILKPAGGRTQAQTIREYCGKVLNFKNKTNQTLVIPNGTKVYKINFYGWSQGDNWTYLAAYGPSTEWEFEDKNISNQNDDIIANAKYPLDPCVISDSYRENTAYPTQYPNGDRVYHNAGYCFASIDFSDEPYEGEFWFKFDGNNQERAWMVIYTTKEDAAAAPAAEAVTLGKDKSQTIFIDAADAIEGVKTVKSEGNNVMYNLSGQKVGAGYKGLVIKNGKKYVIK